MKKRDIFDELLKQKDDRKISFLIGARQVGKTILLKQLHEKICVNEKNKGAFLDVDIFSNFEKVSSFENLLNFLILNGYEKDQRGFFYLFLDEFQRYHDISIIMKNAYDNLQNVKIYASGSSSLKIKDKIQESLAGRRRINIIYPLNFKEFLYFKGEDELIRQLEDINKLVGDNLNNVIGKFNQLLKEFMIWGGYPDVVLKKNKEEKIEVIRSIFDLYVKKDLVEYLNVKKILNVKKLIEYLAINNGQKIVYEEVGQVSSLEYGEIINYIEVLKETYLLSLIRPIYTNKNKELVKIPKVYFLDNGVRNYFINNFNSADMRDDAGFLFEGYILSEILKYGINPEDVKFWNDKNKHEVDIILQKENKTIPIEIKFKTNLKSSDRDGIYSYLAAYPKIKNAFLINLGMQLKEKNLHLILPYDFMKFIDKFKDAH